MLFGLPIGGSLESLAVVSGGQFPRDYPLRTVQARREDSQQETLNALNAADNNEIYRNFNWKSR